MRFAVELNCFTLPAKELVCHMPVKQDMTRKETLMKYHRFEWRFSLCATLFFTLLISSPRLQAMSKTASKVAVSQKAQIKKTPAKNKVKAEHETQKNKNKRSVFHFDKIVSGKIPHGWKIEETNAKGPSAKWQVIADKTAPSTPRVLSLVDSKKHSGETFNLCWTDKIRLRDGELQVRFKANSGKEDQGGGLMWRVQDKDNYYIVRFNPLEDNFRLYLVKNAQRQQLLSAEVQLKAGQWHSMKVVQKRQKFSAYLDGKKLLEGSDNSLTKAGGVGLWTKADAETSFDDFAVKQQ